MSAAATSDMANGRKYIDAQTLRHLRLLMWLRPSATASAQTTVAGTESNSSCTVLPTAVQNVGVGQHLFITAEADELARAARLDPVERIHDRLRERHDEHGAEEQERGQDEQESCPLAPLEIVLREKRGDTTARTTCSIRAPPRAARARRRGGRASP